MSKKHTGPSMPELQKRYDVLKKRLPAQVAAKAKNFFQDSFRRQAWFGNNGLERWEQRKNNAEQGRSILVKTGLLRRSLNTRVQANVAAVYVNGPAKRYAGVHNAGGTINNPGGQPYIVLPANKVQGFARRMPRRGDKVIVFLKRNRGTFPKNVRYTKPFTFKMPQRRFIGQSNVLNRQLLVHIHKQLRAMVKP